jgi:NCS1 family nucleobase:cation symporter-1
MRGLDLQPISTDEQTSSPTDLFLIFVGANIVATTLQVGASLPASFSLTTALTVIAIGAIAGAALTAVLAPIGTRLRVPSIVATRAALGFGGAQLLALLLFVTNFAWIALNNVIAASITSQVTGLGGPTLWAVGLGLAATIIVLGGPKTAAVVDRIAVPLLLLAGVVFTVAAWRSPAPVWPTGGVESGDVVRGFDVVIGYQASWLLMFADYPRFVRSPRGAGIAVFLGLALTALWFMPLGLVGAAVAGSSDPGAMVAALNLGMWGAVLVALAALTTNFVNIYMSALALRSLMPRLSAGTSVWIIGGVGSLLGLFSQGWLEQFAGFTLILATGLIPVGGILLAHFFVLRPAVDVPALYDTTSTQSRWHWPGLLAWLVGGVTYQLSTGIGGTLPSLMATIATYLVAMRIGGRYRT